MCWADSRAVPAAAPLTEVPFKVIHTGPTNFTSAKMCNEESSLCADDPWVDSVVWKGLFHKSKRCWVGFKEAVTLIGASSTVSLSNLAPNLIQKHHCVMITYPLETKGIYHISIQLSCCYMIGDSKLNALLWSGLLEVYEISEHREREEKNKREYTNFWKDVSVGE